jgi:hypothetical protein
VKAVATRLCTSLAFILALFVSVDVRTGSNERFAVVVDGKVGFIDSRGAIVIPPQFFPVADMAHFAEGLAPVIGPDGSGYIDAWGRFVIGPYRSWLQPRPFHDGFAVTLLTGEPGTSNLPALIDRHGRVVLFGTTIRETAVFSDERLAASRDGRWGFIDRALNWIIEPSFDDAAAFSEGLGAVKLGPHWGFVDRSGRLVVPPSYDSVWAFQDGVARVRQGGLIGFVDRDGKSVLPPQFASATSFNDGRAFASPAHEALFSLIDKLGNPLTPAHFETASEFAEALAAVCRQGRCGYIDRGGGWRIEPRFSRAGSFHNGLARVAWDGGHGYIGKSGRIVWKTP